MTLIEAWTGVGAVGSSPRKLRRARLSAQRHAIARWLSIFFEVPNEEHQEIDTRRNAGAASFRVEGGSETFNEDVQPGTGHNLVELPVKRIPRSLPQLIRRPEQLHLLRFPSSLAACRTYAHVLNPTLYDSIWSVNIFGEGVLMAKN